MHEIEKIINAGNCEIVIKWKDGKSQSISASAMQNQCPCVECLVNTQKNKRDIKILFFELKGRLGIKVQFSDGCSKGIYSFNQIRSWLKN
jgi:DUF971 family protein